MVDDDRVDVLGAEVFDFVKGNRSAIDGDEEVGF